MIFKTVKMSFFGKMFGAKKEPTMTTGDAIQKLRETENMLLKKQDFLEKKIEQELAEAKKNGTKNKRGNTSSTKFLWSFNQNFPTPCFSLLYKRAPGPLQTLATIFQYSWHHIKFALPCLRFVKKKSNESWNEIVNRLLDDCFYRSIHCNDWLRLYLFSFIV